MKLLVRIIFILELALALTSSVWSQTHTGKVVAISDGDTFTLLTADKQQIKIRLAEIDTPEKGQPYGQKARETLSSLIFGKQVRVEQTDTDRYGRTIARAYQGNTDVNAEMVRQGAAWVYRQYAKDKALYAMEEEAKTAGIGLWGLPEAQRMAPWEWRRSNSGANNSKVAERVQPSATTSDEYECGSKRYCKEMSSCEEARYYLEHCGLTRLDGDGDGVPCESLCR